MFLGIGVQETIEVLEVKCRGKVCLVDGELRAAVLELCDILLDARNCRIRILVGRILDDALDILEDILFEDECLNEVCIRRPVLAARTCALERIRSLLEVALHHIELIQEIPCRIRLRIAAEALALECDIARIAGDFLRIDGLLDIGVLLILREGKEASRDENQEDGNAAEYFRRIPIAHCRRSPTLLDSVYEIFQPPSCLTSVAEPLKFCTLIWPPSARSRAISV